MYIVKYKIYNSITNICISEEQKKFKTEKETIHYILLNRIYNWSIEKEA